MTWIKKLVHHFIIDILLVRGQNLQVFHYTRYIRPKRVMTWQDPSPHHCARATQLLSKKRRNGDRVVSRAGIFGSGSGRIRA